MQDPGPVDGPQAGDGLVLQGVEAAPVGIAFADSSLRLLYANDAFRAAAGIEVGSALGAYPNESGALAEAAQGVLGMHAGSELELVGASGERSLVALLFPLEGRRVGIVLTDASDRAALRESEERFAAFMDNAPSISFMVDDADRAVYLSRPYLQAFGFGPEMIGRSAWELFPPDFVEQYLAYMHRARETGEVVTVSVPAPREDGIAHFLAHYFPMPDTSGSLVGGVAIDVTELVRTQEALKAVADEQSALLRVATVVAREAPEDEVFGLVAAEVARLFGVQVSTMMRFEEGDRATVVGHWSAEGIRESQLGATFTVDGETVLAVVRRTREPSRVDSYEEIPGELAALARNLGLRASAAAPILLQEELWGALIVSTTEDGALPPGVEKRLGRFTELAAQALSNSEARRELAASRRRIVEAADEARRRIERDLHDGAQQRLVSHALALKLARDRVRSDPDAAEQLLDGAAAELALALDELRELARGIHPALLTERGLVLALEAAAGRASVPVEIRADLEHRLPDHVEVAFYFVASEALANIQKYARATSATVTVTTCDGEAWIEIEDDGVGGAESTAGSGLRGLADRVEALGGRMTVQSPSGGGTRVRAAVVAATSPATELTGAARLRGTS